MRTNEILQTCAAERDAAAAARPGRPSYRSAALIACAGLAGLFPYALTGLFTGVQLLGIIAMAIGGGQLWALDMQETDSDV